MKFKTKVIVFAASFVLAFSAWTEYQSVSAAQDLKELVVNASNLRADTTLAKENFTFSLATPKDTYESYLTALANNDETALYRTFSPGILDMYQNLINSDTYQKTTKGLTLGDRIRVRFQESGRSYNLPEIDFEKIEGNGAYLRCKNAGAPFLLFIKEGNDWKIATLPEYKKTAQTMF